MQNRNVALDVLRFIAVFAIVIHHLGMHSPELDRLRIGVDLFFVLSGYLVSGLIIGEIKATKDFSFRRFFIRRGFKIYPTYYIFIVVNVLAIHFCFNDIHFFMGHEVKFDINTISEYFFFQNYLTDWSPATHTWSIAIEEHFYLLLGLIFPFFYKKYGSKVLPWLIGIIVGIAIARMIYAMPRGAQAINLLRVTHFRLDTLLMGVVLRVLVERLTKVRMEQIATRYFWPSSFFIGFMLWAHIGYYTLTPAPRNSYLGLSTIAFTFAMMLFLFIFSRQINSFLSWKPLKWPVSLLVYVGQCSYGIYLVHILAMLLFDWIALHWLHIGYMDGIIYWANKAVFAVLIGICTTKLIEDPFLKLRDRLYPSAARTSTTGS